MIMDRNEVHVCHSNTGHINSVDCWCEPQRIYWYTNPHGVKALIVEHEEATDLHRIAHIALRERDKNLICDGSLLWGIDEPWITRILDITYGAGPVEPNERNI